MVKRSVVMRSGAAVAGFAWLALMLAVCGIPQALAQGTPAAAPVASTQTPQPQVPPAQVQELLRLLQDPAVASWLAVQEGAGHGKPAPASAEKEHAKEKGKAVAGNAAPEEAEEPLSAGEEAAHRIEGVRRHIADLVAAVPLIGAEARTAGLLIQSEINNRRPIGILVLVLGFVALGSGLEWLARRFAASARRQIAAMPMLTPVQVMKALGTGLGFDLAMVGVFALGSIVAFLALPWPDIIKQVVLNFLLAIVVFRLINLGLHFLLRPGRRDPETYHLRLVPLSDGDAAFWYRRFVAGAAWFMFGWASVISLRPLAFTLPSRMLVAYVLGLGLLLLALEVIWRRPPRARRVSAAAEAGEAAGEGEAVAAARHRPLINALLCLYVVLLWVLWVGGLSGLFWLGVLAVALPQALRVVGQATAIMVAAPLEAIRNARIAQELEHQLEQERMLAEAAASAPEPLVEDMVELPTAGVSVTPEAMAATATVVVPASVHAAATEVAVPAPAPLLDGDRPLPAVAIYLERGLRALLIAGAALFLAKQWNVDLAELTAQDSTVTRLVRGVLSGVVILLVADLLWQLIKSLIDHKLRDSQFSPEHSDAERARRAKMRTLLPIFRNIIFITLISMAVLTALAAMGVQIGPLIAGAGVVGVAVGFGAQTIVRDIISGMFYLFDDAFRVGEYIICGRHKGTVESFSLRSIKLRHHRGPVFTVPFGQLGAVENMSRDWVIDKMSVNVTYDTDLDKVKKIIRNIGQELQANPDYGRHIMEPLKLQGIDAFGDFAIQIRMKIKTRPGEQFVIRRRANAMLREAFAKNGINFARPMVEVKGGGDSPDAGAAARNLMVAREEAASAAAGRTGP